MKDHTEVSQDLPPHWRTVALGEVATVMNGGTPKSKVADYWDGGVQWLTPKDMGRMEEREVFSTQRTISETGLKKSSARLVPPRSVILSTRAPIGHLAINAVPMSFNQGCRGIVVGDHLDHIFLYYFLAANREALDRLGSGTTFKELSATNLKAISLPLPPLEEQKRIVAVLDQAFAGLDRARSLAEANIAGAECLFENYLAQVFSEGGDGWSSSCVGDVMTLQRGFDITKKDQVEGPFPVVSSGGTKSFHIEAKATAPGVVVGRKGSIGRIHFIEEDFWPHDTTLFVKDFKGNNPLLVFYLLRGLKLAGFDTGAANPSLNRNLIHPLPVMWPNRDQQTRIAHLLRRVEDSTQNLRLRYLSKLGQITSLRQSLLQKAFSGQLIG